MRSATFRTTTQAVLGLVIAILVASGAVADPAQDAPEAGVSDQPTDVNPILAPPAPPNLLLRPSTSHPVAEFLSPQGPDHRGSYFTNAGHSSTNELNGLEETKLAMARAACDAAELAGTRAIVPTSTVVYSPDDIEAIKQQALEAVRSLQTSPSPQVGESGIGRPSDLMGPIETIPVELQRSESARSQEASTEEKQPTTDDTTPADNPEAR